MPYFAVTVRFTLGSSTVEPVDWMVTIVEPVVGNMGVVPPEPGFLEEILALCRTHRAGELAEDSIEGRSRQRSP